MRTNTFPPVFTHEGAKSTQLKPLDALKRSVMTCMLWEDNFYEDGKSIVERIEELCKHVDKVEIMRLAEQAYQKGYLRHVPLKLLVEAMKKPSKKGDSGMIAIIDIICNRPDQMTELLSLYWKNGKKPIPAQMKKGLARAFTKFDEYQLAKYNRDNPIKLRDVLFLCHAKPKDKDQEDLWKRLINNTLKTPDTWETRLSSGEDKKESFKELLEKGKMGKLAILRNLRNMRESGIDKDLVKQELLRKSRPILPFQFIVAAKHNPQWEDVIDESMVQACQDKFKLKGMTVVFVDVSGSMVGSTVSAKSEITYQDAASGLAILLRETCENVEFFSFSNNVVAVPPRRGMALRDAILKSQPSGGTYLGQALRMFESKRNGVKIDRIIVITDEQAHDVPPKMNIDKCYVLNVANCKNGIHNNGQWLTVSGFSEASIDYIRELEEMDE